MKKRILIIAAILHLVLILIVNIRSTTRGYFKLYKPTEELEDVMVYKSCKYIESLPLVSPYLSYTGIETGYGFFAPNVSSNFIITFSSLNESGQVLKQMITPKFKNKESLIRFVTMFNIFFEKIKEQKDRGLYDKYIDVIIEQLTESVIPNLVSEEVKCYETTIYIYDFPKIRDFQFGKKEELRFVQTFRFDK